MKVIEDGSKGRTLSVSDLVLHSPTTLLNNLRVFLVKQGTEDQAGRVESVHNVWTMQGIFDQANNHCRVFTHM